MRPPSGENTGIRAPCERRERFRVRLGLSSDPNTAAHESCSFSPRRRKHVLSAVRRDCDTRRRDARNARPEREAHVVVVQACLLGPGDPRQERQRDGRQQGRRNLPWITVWPLLGRSTMPESAVRQGVSEVRSGPEPIRREPLQGPVNGRLHVRRYGGAMLADRRGRAGDDAAQDRLGTRPRVRRLAREAFVQNTAQGVDVRRGPHDLVSGRLLRAHILRRSHTEAGRCQPIGPACAHRQRDAEVGDQGLAVPYQDVGRFHVTVHHPLPVGMVKGLGHIGGNANRFVDRKLPLAFETLTEGLALHIRHDVEEEIVGFPRVEEREDMGVLQTSRRLDFGEEAVSPDCRGQLRLQDLQRNLAPMFEVLGQVDRGHASRTELADDAVATPEGFVELGRGVHVHGERMGLSRPLRE